MQELPATAGIELANWNWKVVHRFVRERFGLSLCRSSCLNWLHRLGFSFKRPKKRLVKANESKRAGLRGRVCRSAGTKSGTHLSGKDHCLPTRPTSGLRRNCGGRGRAERENPPWWTRPARSVRGEGQLLLGGVLGDRRGGVDGSWQGNSNSETSAAFLEQLRERHGGRLTVIWDNAPAPLRASSGGASG